MVQRPPQYRVLPSPRLGASFQIGLVALVIALGGLLQGTEVLLPTPPDAPETRRPTSPLRGDPLVVHIQDSGFFIEGADAVLAPADRRIWCESDRCDEQDMRLLTRRLAAVKHARPGAEHVVFVAGMTVPFGRVQAAMDAARQDRWDALPGDPPDWLFPRVTVQPGTAGQDRYLRRTSHSSVRL